MNTMKKVFVGWKPLEMAALVLVLVVGGFITFTMQRYAIRSANQRTITNPEAYPRFIYNLVDAADKECQHDVSCHQRWVRVELPKSLTADEGYSAEDVARVQSDVWYITSGKQQEDTINAMLPNGLREALMKSNSAAKVNAPLEAAK